MIVSAGDEHNGFFVLNFGIIISTIQAEINSY